MAIGMRDSETDPADRKLLAAARKLTAEQERAEEREIEVQEHAESLARESAWKVEHLPGWADLAVADNPGDFAGALRQFERRSLGSRPGEEDDGLGVGDICAEGESVRYVREAMMRYALWLATTMHARSCRCEPCRVGGGVGTRFSTVGKCRCGSFLGSHQE